jgi:hypothetical protein
MLRRRESQQEARRRLATTRKRMSAVLDRLESLESLESLPPVGSGTSPRRGPLDVRASPRDVVAVRQAVLVPAPPGGASSRAHQTPTQPPAGLTPRGTARFRRVAAVQQQAEERFRQTQRETLFGDSQPIRPPTEPFAIPPPPAVATADSDALLREFEQAWMEAGRGPSPLVGRPLSGTPPQTWRWRTSSRGGIRTPRNAQKREVKRVVQTERAPQQHSRPVNDGVDWDRALAELRSEEQEALEMQFRSTQPLNTGLATMQKSWKHFTTPGWILDNLDEPELYTYTLRKRRVRVKTEPTPEPTPTPPRTPTPEPEPEPEAPPPPPESADDKLARMAAGMELGYEFKTLRQFATFLWGLLHKARILLVAESIEQDGDGNYTIQFPPATPLHSGYHDKMPKSIQHGSAHKRVVTGAVAKQLEAAGLTDCSEDEMGTCADELAPYIPLLEKLRAENIAGGKIALPDPAKVRSYVAGLLVRCNMHTHAIAELGDCLDALRGKVDAGPSGATHLLASRAHAAIAARRPDWQNDHEYTHTYGEHVLPAARATHTALFVRPTDSVLTGQLRRHTRDVRQYRLYADFPKKAPTKYAEWGGHEPQQEEPEVESASKWDLVLERVKDILVDHSDHRLTRNTLIASIPLLLDKYNEYVTIVPRGNAKAGFERMEPVEVRDGSPTYRNWVATAISKLWGDDVESDECGNTIEDVVDEMDHPAEIMTMGQLRELCRDTKITCRELLTAAIGRLWLKSCRKDCVFSGPTAEATGDTVFTIHDPSNPHDMRNEGHVYEYLEVMIRLANAKYSTKAKKVGEQLQKLVKENLKPHKTTQHVLNPKDKPDKDRWETLDPEVVEVQDKMEGGTEFLYRYFALREDQDAGVTTAAEAVRKKEDAGRILNFWNAVDSDGSGMLDVLELKEVLLGLGKELTDEEVDVVMKEIDTDGSGEVEMPEFIGYAILPQAQAQAHPPMRLLACLLLSMPLHLSSSCSASAGASACEEGLSICLSSDHAQLADSIGLLCMCFAQQRRWWELHAVAHNDEEPAKEALSAHSWKTRTAVRKTPLLAPFIYKNEHFTKTGSGQT